MSILILTFLRNIHSECLAQPSEPLTKPAADCSVSVESPGLGIVGLWCQVKVVGDSVHHGSVVGFHSLTTHEKPYDS